jgi:NADH-quinone oxidoreductase subunit L
MTGLVQHLWLIPVLPLLAAGAGTLCRRPQRAVAASLAIGSMAAALVLSCAALVITLTSGAPAAGFRAVRNFDWFQVGEATVKLGWVLDPLTASMLVMVSLVGLLIFIYSVGYMAHDENFTRFFCFLSLFAGAMLGVVLANSLLLLFIGWELVGLASYLLIGFWYHKPTAAAAAKKAFVTTRVGDVGLFLGLLWLYRETGTLVFYDDGKGCLETAALAGLAGPSLSHWPVLMGIGLLIFCGAAGKSGQVPLHVWLPDAMEGPTPVSALIHAATMVAAGVFLVARVFALIKPDWGALVGPSAWVSLPPPDATLVIAWVGAVTAVFAALIAVAQTDIKRILAYSTVSQLGYMMMGLGVGGVAVGMFHLLTHAFFKALLFLGAGSVIHGCHDEQDIRRMGGLRKAMPVTFVTYAIGMAALAGVIPLAGFWSKDGILHAAHGWGLSRGPFYLGLFGALLTAFYMTRQVCLVFFGRPRLAARAAGGANPGADPNADGGRSRAESEEPVPHESPWVMTVPLIVLAVFAALLGLLGTPGWPWLQTYLGAEEHPAEWGSVLGLMGLSSVVVVAGLGLGWWLYGRRPRTRPDEPDMLERLQPDVFGLLRAKFFVDELYDATVVRLNARFSRFCHRLDAVVLEGAVTAARYGVLGLSWVARLADENLLNPGFDQGCHRARRWGGRLSKMQDGQIQNYLRALGLALTVFLLLLLWGCRT